MKVAVQYVKDRVEAEGLDRLIATAKGYGAASGGIIAKANGSADVMEILDTLPGQVAGDFVVKVWKESPNKGRKGLDERAYTFILDGTMNGTGMIQGANASGPTWREYLDLKLQLAKNELEQRYAGKEDDTWKTLAPMIQGIAAQLMGNRPHIVPEPIAATPPNPAPRAEQDEELNAILKDVVRFYRKSPGQARQFAPMLRQMIDGNGASA